MAEHTPGPWVLEEAAFQGRDTISHPKIGLIAILAEHDTGEREWRQDEANARLIAASPDLLAACKRLVEVLESDPPEEEIEIAVYEANVAILKADGVKE